MPVNPPSARHPEPSGTDARAAGERDALKLAYAAVSDGAAGVDMGRNIFQSRWPVQMIRTVRMIVHEGLTDAQAWTEFQKMVG